MDSERTATRRIKEWIVSHDDSWYFILPYVGLAVVLSVFISLFWLAVVVGIHLLFELVRQQHSIGWKSSMLPRALWEIKLDISLVLFALGLAVYMDVVMGVAGVSGAARMGVQGGARFVGWHKVIQGILISLDDAALLARGVIKGSENAKGAGDSSAGESVTCWTKGDYCSLGFGVICALLIVLAPLMTDHTYSSVLHVMAEEMHPWPP